MKLSFNRMALPLLAVAMGGLGFYHVNQASQTAPAAPPPESPAASPFLDSIGASGLVEAQTENISIGAALSGLVLEVYVPTDQVGTHVTAGQPLFRVDDRHLKAQLKVAQAQVAVAQARLERLQQQPRPEELPPSLARVHVAAADTARLLDQYERAGRLIKKGATTEEEFVARQREYEAALHEQERAQTEYDLLKAGAWKPDLDIARATLAEACARVEQVQIEIDRATVTAPVDGVILQVNVRAGERVSEQDNKTLMVLGNVDTVHVRVDIDERDTARFRQGAPARAYPRGDTSHALPIRCVRVEPLVVPKKTLTGESTERVDTRVLQVIYAIEPTGRPVYVGQQLDVFIEGSTAMAAADRPSEANR